MNYKADLNYKIKNLDGKPSEFSTGKTKKNKETGKEEPAMEHLTMRKILENVCIDPIPELSPTGQPLQIPGDEKISLFKIVMRIQKNTDGLLNLESEEVTLLKKHVKRKYHSPLTVGQAINVLDPFLEEEEKKKEEEKEAKEKK